MNRQIVRNLAIAMICMMIAALIIAAAESKGAALESRIGLIGIVIVAALAFSTFALGTNPPKPDTPEKPVSKQTDNQTKRPKK